MTSADSASVDASGVIRLAIPEQWDVFLDRYLDRYTDLLGDLNELEKPEGPDDLPAADGDRDRDYSLREIFRFIRHHATHVMIEDPYFDSDNQDEYAKHYAHTFQREPGRCERIHLFALPDLPSEEAERGMENAISEIDDALRRFSETGDRDSLDRATEQYMATRERLYPWWGDHLGFVVLRPSLNHPVGRTVLRPPGAIRSAVSCVARFRARPAGNRYEIRGFPFLSQDGQLATCAHAAIWMIAYYHHQLNGTRRVYLSDIATETGLRPEETPGDVERGMTFPQMASVLRHIGLPAIYHRADDDSPQLIKRYLNSRLPVLVASHDHVMVLIGHGWDSKGEFWVAHNDLRGPYVTVRTTRANLPSDGNSDKPRRTRRDKHIGVWEAIFIPRPSHTLYMKGDEAEDLGKKAFDKFVPVALDIDNLDDLVARGAMALSTYTIQANDYKERLRGRIRDEHVLRNHIAEPMPKWVWVVELHDLRQGRDDEPVIGELILDATADSETAGVLCGNLPGLWFKQDSFLLPKSEFTVEVGDYPMYGSGLPLSDVEGG